VSADQQRPAEAAARQHAADEARLAVSQLTGLSGHSAAVMSGPEGYSVADRTDPRITGPAPMDLPPAPDAASTHAGPA